MIINTSNIEAAKKLIKAAQKPILVRAQNDAFNRVMLEYGKFDVLVDIESGARKDSLRTLDSGCNEVLVRIATKNNISLGIDLAELSKLEKKDKAIRLARIRQNIILARKAGTKLKILNALDHHAASSFLISLGASTAQAKQAISF